MKKSKTIIEVSFDVEELLQECKAPLDVLTEFYKELCSTFGLDWDDVSNIDPVEIRVSERDWGKMCEHMASFGADDEEKAGLGFLFVNKGPGSDFDIPVGTVRLLEGWVEEVSYE